MGATNFLDLQTQKTFFDNNHVTQTPFYIVYLINANQNFTKESNFIVEVAGGVTVVCAVSGPVICVEKTALRAVFWQFFFKKVDFFDFLKEKKIFWGRKNFSSFLNFIFTQFATTFLLITFEFEQILEIVIFVVKNLHILKEKIFFQLFFEFCFCNFFFHSIWNNFSIGHI